MAAANQAYAELGVVGWIMCHLSHSYHSGACLYFTFAFRHDDDPLAQYDRVKTAIQQAFVDSDATLSHHHAVGTEHAPWLEQDISAAGVAHDRRAVRGDGPRPEFQPGQDRRQVARRRLLGNTMQVCIGRYSQPPQSGFWSSTVSQGRVN